jgi:hypothetical protein
VAMRGIEIEVKSGVWRKRKCTVIKLSSSLSLDLQTRRISAADTLYVSQ